jgi:DNA-binding transcriptional MerR regulator
MKIGELAQRSGVSVRSLRYYEEQQLLHSTRTPGGHREYLPTAVDRVQLIQELYAAGLPSSAILELLPCVETGLVSDGLMSRLRAEQERIDRQIEALTGASRRMAALISGAGNPRTCVIADLPPEPATAKGASDDAAHGQRDVVRAAQFINS